jgi:hypothetical protein
VIHRLDSGVTDLFESQQESKVHTIDHTTQNVPRKESTGDNSLVHINFKVFDLINPVESRFIIQTEDHTLWFAQILYWLNTNLLEFMDFVECGITPEFQEFMNI